MKITQPCSNFTTEAKIVRACSGWANPPKEFNTIPKNPCFEIKMDKSRYRESGCEGKKNKREGEVLEGKLPTMGSTFRPLRKWHNMIVLCGIRLTFTFRSPWLGSLHSCNDFRKYEAWSSSYPSALLLLHDDQPTHTNTHTHTLEKQ